MPKAELNMPTQGDDLASRVAAGIASMNDGENIPELNMPLDGVDLSGFRSQLENAGRSLLGLVDKRPGEPDRLDEITAAATTAAQSGEVDAVLEGARRDKTGSVRPSDYAPLDLQRQTEAARGIHDDPLLAETLGAAFRQGNMIGSALASESLREWAFPTPGSEPLSTDDLLTKIKQDGLVQLEDRFMDVHNEAQYEAKKNDIDHELRDRQILEASGVTGTIAQIAYGTIDVPLLLPIGGELRMAQTGLKAAARGAVTAGTAVAIQSAGLQATQNLRTTEESAFNVGAATVLGAGLGITTHMIVSPRTAAFIENRLNEKFDDMRDGNPKANAAGAQAVGVYRALRDRGLLDTERVNALGVDKVLKNLGAPFRKIGLDAVDQGLRNPVLDLMDSASPTARDFVTKFVSMPWITKANVAGIENPQNVAGLVSQARGRLAEFFREADLGFKQNRAKYPGGREDFAQRVYYAAINGDVAADGDEIVTNAAQVLRRNVFEPIRKGLVEAGLLKDDAAVKGARSYVPRVYNKIAVAAKKDRFLEVAEGWAFARIQAAAKNGEEGVPVTEAAQRKAAAETSMDIFDTLTGSKPRDAADYAPTTTTRGFLKGRVFDVPDQQLADEGFLIKNIFDLSSRYTRTAGTDAAIAKVFSKVETGADEAGNAIENTVGDVKLSSVIDGVKKEFTDLIGSASGADIAKLTVERDRIIAGIENLRDIARGTFLPEQGANLAKTAEMTAMFNYMRLLGGTVASSLSDPVNLVIANGFGRTMRYGVAPLLKDFRAAMRSGSLDKVGEEDMRRLSRISGAVTEIEHNSRMAQLGDFDDLYATGDRALSFMRKLSSTFSKVSGITYWNTFVKQIAYNTTQARIIENVKLGLDGIGTAERAWMASLGIGPQQAADIAEAYSKQVGRKVVAGGLPYANHELWPTEIGNVFRSALANEVDNQIITPKLGDRPIFASTPIGKLMFQFRGYVLANQARLIGRNAQLAMLDETGARKVSFASGLFGIVAMSALIDGMKKAMSSNDASWDHFSKQWSDHPGEALYRALDRSSVLGMITEGSNIIDRAGGPSLMSGLQYAFGDAKNKGHRDAEFFGALGIPTVNLVNDVAHLAFSDVPQGKVTPGAVKRVRGLIPFQSVPIIQQAINKMQSEVGTVYDWPQGHQ